ncbi:MAG: 2-phosphosulfolactate phosphatase [Bacteroidetes bacterium]|nr:MAG: 2-phosphosulfolactate phosphatase [Bacteroidota bacterium]TAG86901.1 MAG: 2-phosphosulfolactate phosphatase [Bacteroidota bacterium]
MASQIEVCLTPDLLPHFDLKDKIVVVIDILRATSCITTALASGVKSIIPVREVEECKALQQKGYLAAAERGGKKVEGFDLDNSPFSYQNPDLKGKTIAMTTSNGTLAIDLSKNVAKEVLIGSFLNQRTLCNYLQKKEDKILLFCAGWKGKENMEDTFFAGALIDDLSNMNVELENDGAFIAKAVYHVGRNQYKKFLRKSSHYQRLIGFGLEKDIDFCFTANQYDVLPYLKGNEIVL